MYVTAMGWTCGQNWAGEMPIEFCRGSLLENIHLEDLEIDVRILCAGRQAETYGYKELVQDGGLWYQQ